MNNNLNLITTHKDYILLVDEKFPEIGDWFYITVTENVEQLKDVDYGEFHPHKMLWPKVTAHSPLNNAPVLEGVPLLPELPKQEEDVEQRFTTQDLDEGNYEDLQHWVKDDALHGLIDEKMGGIIGYIHHEHINRVADILNGYKAASQRRYTEEDIRKAFRAGENYENRYNYPNAPDENEYLQSLSPVTLPVGFEPEYDYVPAYKDSFDRKFKTIKNDKGQEVLVGRYVYE